jgi:hypothetical protein
MSPFVRLPAEIRNTIWDFAVGGHRVDPPKSDLDTGRHVKGGAFVTKDITTEEFLLGSNNTDHIVDVTIRWLWEVNAVRRGRDHAYVFSKMRDIERVLTAFHLPEVCRQIYADTATMAYRLSILNLDREDSDWIDTLVPAQLDTISSVEPSVYLARDMYSGYVAIRPKVPQMRSLRRKFKPQKVYITKKTVKQIMFANHRRPDWDTRN